jgi:hypothetical protein
LSDLPVVCTLGSGPPLARRQQWLAELIGKADRREETAEGWRLSFAAGGDTLIHIAQAVEAERQCCRFLRFEITVEPDGGPVSLELTGPPGTRPFLAALFEPCVGPPPGSGGDGLSGT